MELCNHVQSQPWKNARLSSKEFSLPQAVPDATGREDLVKALRERLLLAAAASRMVTMLARGDSSDRLAARVIALSAKGCGFALPSTLHFLDARSDADSNDGTGIQAVCDAEGK